MLPEILTLSGAGLILYHHVGYPKLLRLLARRQPAAPQMHDCDELPGITILVPAHQEAAVIADKIRNLAALDYPVDRFEVVILCDGCRDETAAIARATALEPEVRHLRLMVIELPVNRGKVAVLNEAIPACRHAIVVLTDASALLSLDALKQAAAHFADPAIGVVCATYRLLTPGSAGEAAYWSYQTAIKEMEARLGAPLGAHGACYMIRRDLFEKLPADTINDDFILPLRIVQKGWRAVYDPTLLALELECANGEMDFRRRLRISAGNMQQALRFAPLLHPKFGGVAFTFLSGKAMRTIMPFIMLGTLAGSALLAPQSPFFALLALGQAALYGVAGARALLPRFPWPGAVEPLFYLVSGHLAGLIGSTRYLLGLERKGWRRAVS